MPMVPSESKSIFSGFIDLCRADHSSFALTPNGTPSPFALCFGIFAMHLIGRNDELAGQKQALDLALRENIVRERKAAGGQRLVHGKSYRQLLTLTLSALEVLGTLDDDPLIELVQEQLPLDNVAHALELCSALTGRAQSGNQAMFIAIFLIHVGRYGSRDTSSAVQEWVKLHLNTMNRFGFWGSNAGPTHLQFQNGYHQYEIFEYLDVHNPKEATAGITVSSLADDCGHYAPYPGGGACYDYDAVFLLTPRGNLHPSLSRDLLITTMNTILAEQTSAGGFCENCVIRPRLRSYRGFAERLATSPSWAGFLERLRYFATLQRPKYNWLRTHWTDDWRHWSEPDLFSSWFRMLTIARIECAIEPTQSQNWGFIRYPGIGWHPSLT